MASAGGGRAAFDVASLSARWSRSLRSPACST
jgi:hypothetical protein